MKRKDVYDLIDSERDYQEAEWPTSQALPTPGEMVLMRSYLRKFEEEYQKDDDAPNESAPIGALHMIRKMGALCVRALENVDPGLKDELTRK